MISLLRISTALLATVAADQALASSSDWFEMEGVRVRLVTAGGPDADGTLKGALDIELEPGWKTYWRDPGVSGVPPTIDATSAGGAVPASFDFPVPQWQEDADVRWAGYDRSVVFPVTFTIGANAAKTTIDASIFLGVCEMICVPVQAKLAVDPMRDPKNADDMTVVAKAFAAVPPPARPDFGVTVVSKPGEAELVLDAVVPGDAQTAELFIAGDEGYTFTAPVRTVRDGKTLFTTKASLPAKPATGKGLHYTLVTDKGAVNGLLPYF